MRLAFPALALALLFAVTGLYDEPVPPTELDQRGCIKAVLQMEGADTVEERVAIEYYVFLSCHDAKNDPDFARALYKMRSR